MSDKVFIYWDNSNIFIEAQRLAEEREQGGNPRARTRIHFENMLRLAHADRKVAKALAAGSILPEMRKVWSRLQGTGVSVQLFERDSNTVREQEVPDQILQIQMLEDALDNIEDPGIAVLMTGDGKGYREGKGFHSTLERLHRRGWRIEVLSWQRACNHRMREWAEENGIFIALDDFYESITFMEQSRPGYEFGPYRVHKPIDMARRMVFSLTESPEGMLEEPPKEFPE